MCVCVREASQTLAFDQWRHRMASGESGSITESAGVSTKQVVSERERDADMETERHGEEETDECRQ